MKVNMFILGFAGFVFLLSGGVLGAVIAEEAIADDLCQSYGYKEGETEFKEGKGYWIECEKPITNKKIIGRKSGF